MGAGPDGEQGRGSGCGRDATGAELGPRGYLPWGRGPAVQPRVALIRAVPPFRRCVPPTASTLSPAPASGVTVALFPRLVAPAEPELAMSGPNGDLGMPVEADAEGEDDGFGEAGDWGGGA